MLNGKAAYRSIISKPLQTGFNCSIHLTDEEAEVLTDLLNVPLLVYFANKGAYYCHPNKSIKFQLSSKHYNTK